MFEKERQKENDYSILAPPILSQLPPRTTRRYNDRKGLSQWEIPTSSLCFFLGIISLLSFPLVRSFRSSPSFDVVFGFRSKRRSTNSCNYSPNKSNKRKDTKRKWIDLSATPVGLPSTPILHHIETVQELRKGSLILSKVEDSLGCHDLRQPYFHKAVVLVLDHDPDDFTQGVLLNRASNLVLDGKDILYVDDEDNEEYETLDTSWRIHFGGDIAGWYEENPQLLCLHGICTEASRAVSDPIFESNRNSDNADSNANVYITSHRGALSLVQAGEATPDMFYTFSGFCGWEPGQLQREVERGSWCLASFAEEETDKENSMKRHKHSLLDIMEMYSWKNPDYKPQSGGLELWHRLMTDLGEAKTLLPNNQAEPFSDLMVKEWATQRLLMEPCIESNDSDSSFDDADKYDEEPKPKSQIEDQDIFRALKVASESHQLVTGAILRGSSPASYLLSGQLFHKSTILVLQENPVSEASIGVILNLVTSDVYKLNVDGKVYEIPIRYGGYSGKQPSEGQEDEEQYFWFHNHQLLKQKDFGLPVSFSSASPESTFQDYSCIYACDITEVTKAIEVGWATPNDFLLVRGFCAWEKEGSSGGLMGQILNGNLQDTKWFQKKPLEQESLWNCLRDQKKLTSENGLYDNLELAETAWDHGGSENSEDNLNEEKRLIFDSNVTVSELADDALFVWMKLFLLGNAAYYPVDL